MNDQPICAYCQQPITNNVQKASDGQPVHEEHESDYEDLVYFREFDDEGDDLKP